MKGFFSIVCWKPRQIRRITYLMSNANSITLEEISCFNLLGEKKKLFHFKLLPKRYPRNLIFPKLPITQNKIILFFTFSSVPCNKKCDSKPSIKLVKRKSSLIDNSIMYRLLSWMSSGFITGLFAHCLKRRLPSVHSSNS